MSTTTAIGLVAIALIIAWNAFFVASEYAFVAARRTRLRELADDVARAARRVLVVMADPTRFIAAIQVAITLSSLALGAIGQPAISHLLESVLGPADSSLGESVTFAISVILAFCIITALHVVLAPAER